MWLLGAEAQGYRTTGPVLARLVESLGLKSFYKSPPATDDIRSYSECRTSNVFVLVTVMGVVADEEVGDSKKRLRID